MLCAYVRAYPAIAGIAHDLEVQMGTFYDGCCQFFPLPFLEIHLAVYKSLLSSFFSVVNGNNKYYNMVELDVV